LSEVTKINIKKVNKERYDIKRAKCGSCPIYSVEYKCTNLEMDVTTTNITTVSVSNIKPQATTKSSDSIQGVS
jgi:hypothetical protein